MLDEQLISKIKAEACDQSLNKLISKHTGLCYDIYKNTYLVKKFLVHTQST